VVSALANAVVIAAYTLIDGLGARLSGAAPAYALYLAVGTAVVTAALVLSGGHRPTLSARTMALGLLGGGATTLSYGVALWAMTRAPVALVAALRETSILFALALSALLLGERVGRGRLVAAALVAAGVVTLKLG
jgi:drug/metabolite transporter (DMT)-like permease